MSTPVYLEVGSKKVFACALDWPGWARAAKTDEGALEALAAYAGRYRAVPEAAGVRFPKSAGAELEVVERLPGSATTDFGAPDAKAAADLTPLTKPRAERMAALLEASWTVFDRVVAATPAELRKGPRGGGRDRDKMVDHVLGAEAAYARAIGLKLRQAPLGDRAAITDVRSAILAALRAARQPAPATGKGWPYRYAARRMSWHVLDHAWEMEDRSR
ncbi:MAG: hypothetical protein M3O23_03870 [Actinomycetota bacterium]|nr:hypothetical protein [Actinomycetota bacterium]